MNLPILIRFHLVIILIVVMVLPAWTQKISSIRQAEDSLAALVKQINTSTTDTARLRFNRFFGETLRQALNLQESENYPFDSLKSLNKVISPDRHFRIFQWNLPGTDGRPRYYGFIRIMGRAEPLVIRLTDGSDSIEGADTVLVDAGHWYGALYYKIIPVDLPDGRKAYTCLGWAAKTPALNQKVIEVITFDTQENPIFGLKIFQGYGPGGQARIIFRYAPTTSMSLKYDRAKFEVKKGWNAKKRSFETSTVDEEIILFDHLVPMDPQLEGQYQYYTPSGDMADGFLYRDFRWAFLGGIDSRNKK